MQVWGVGCFCFTPLVSLVFYFFVLLTRNYWKIKKIKKSRNNCGLLVMPSNWLILIMVVFKVETWIFIVEKHGVIDTGRVLHA